MKRINKVICLLLVLTFFFTVPVIGVYGQQPFEVDARSAILIDAGTGTILYEKNSHEALPPASVTKIMTMLLVMEALDRNQITLDDKVVVSEHASSMGGTQLYLEPGEIKTIEELMKGIAIRSANDACVAIGEHLAGSEETFVQRMNDKAKELGMENTHFVNSNGLPEEGHVTSAYDISLMSRELLKYPEIHRWLTTWMDTVIVGKKQSTQELVNTNRLIRFYDGATGIKTGYTSEAKHCLSASATRGNTTFISVIMGAPTSQVRFNEAAKLLDYGFANYHTIDAIEKDGILGNLPIQKGKLTEISGIAKNEFKLLVQKGEEAKVDKEIILPQYLQAPLEKGAKVGEVIISLNGKEMGRVDIITPDPIEKASFLDIINRMFRKMMGN